MTGEPGYRHPIYDTCHHEDGSDKVAKIKQLCRIGIAAIDTTASIRDMDECLQALLEVIHETAAEADDEIEDLESQIATMKRAMKPAASAPASGIEI